MAITSDQMKKVKDFAIHMDWDVAFHGKSKGNMHLYRVNQLSRYFQDMEGGDKGVILAGAWLHDVGLVEGNLGHCFKGAKIGRNFLAEIGVDYDTILKVVHCIEAHDGEIDALTVEAKVVHDADTVDKMGPLGLIRHAWKMANIDYHSYSVEELLDFLPKHLQDRRDNLYLDSAIGVADRYAVAIDAFFRSKESSKMILREVCQLASEGIPTEMVIERLRKKGLMESEFQQTLDEQLLLSFV